MHHRSHEVEEGFLASIALNYFSKQGALKTICCVNRCHGGSHIEEKNELLVGKVVIGAL